MLNFEQRLLKEITVDDFQLQLTQDHDGKSFGWLLVLPDGIIEWEDGYQTEDAAWEFGLNVLKDKAFDHYQEQEIELQGGQTTRDNIEISIMMGVYGVHLTTFNAAGIPTYWGWAYTPHRSSGHWEVCSSSMRSVVSSLVNHCRRSSFNNNTMFLEGAFTYVGGLGREDLYKLMEQPIPTVFDTHLVKYNWMVKFSRLFNKSPKDG